MQKIAFLALTLLSSAAIADKLINMPNGSTCFMAPTGHVHGCAGGEPTPSAPSAPRGGDDGGSRERRHQAALLEECLRKADWPGQPGRAECRQMYGE